MQVITLKQLAEKILALSEADQNRVAVVQNCEYYEFYAAIDLTDCSIGPVITVN